MTQTSNRTRPCDCGKARLGSLPNSGGLVRISLSALLVAGLCSWATHFAAAQAVTFDFDTGSPTLNVYRTLPVDQTAGGITAHFSALAGNFSIQTDVTTTDTLSSFSGQYLFPSLTRGCVLRIDFGTDLTDITFPFATTDYQIHHPQPTPIVMTAYKVTSGTANLVGSATQSAAYGTDTFPMGTLTFNSGAKPFNRVEVRIQTGGDATFMVDTVTATPVPRLTIGLADPATVVVSWPWPSTGFVLQHKPVPGGTGWINLTNSVEVVNGQNQVTISPPVDNDFYRLFHP